jgi:prophage antirepressor-like protein
MTDKPDLSVLKFDFRGTDVRVVVIDGETWWVAVDVCSALELTNSRKAVSGLDDDEKQTLSYAQFDTDTMSDIEHAASFPQVVPSVGIADTGHDLGKHAFPQVEPTVTTSDSGLDLGRRVSIINESGLYSLILRSRKPAAKAFKRWVTHDVLPSIRRTGTYSTDQRHASSGLPTDMQLFMREVSRVTTDAAVAAAREVGREMGAELRAAVREGFGDMTQALTTCVREVLEAATLPAQRAALAPAADEPLWHASIPTEAMSFGALADRLRAEFECPGITRERLFAIARDARLLRRLDAPYAGHSLLEQRYDVLFAVRRVNGSSRGWECTYHFQPMALPEGVTIMRRLIAQDIEVGTLR